MLPEGVTIDPLTGALTPRTGEYTKRLSEFRSIYRDQKAFEALLETAGDLVTYKVEEYRAENSDIFFGTTTMMPGRVGDEYFMTRGHYHARRDRGEIYYTQSGHGILVLHSRDGQTRNVVMKPGVCAFIPPDWAHRSVNTGKTPLVFTWCCSQDAGHDYDEIATKGMRSLVTAENDTAICIPNPKFTS